MDAVALFLQFVPLEGEVLDFFQPLTNQILHLLRGTNCLPTEPLPSLTPTTFTWLSSPTSFHQQGHVVEVEAAAVEWKQPSQCLYVKDDFIHEHIPQVLLVEALNLHYLHPSLVLSLNPSLRSQLGVKSLSVEHLKEVARVLLCHFHNAQNSDGPEEEEELDMLFLSEDEESESEHSSGHREKMSATQRGRDTMVRWVACWLACMHIVIEESTALTHSALLEKINDLCILPLEDGSFVSVGEGNTIFFPPDNFKGMGKHHR